MEADAECVELNKNASFYYYARNSWFKKRYGLDIDAVGMSAMGDYLDAKNIEANKTPPVLNNPGVLAMRAILQNIYDRIPDDFIEIKRSGYDWYVRPPE